MSEQEHQSERQSIQERYVDARINQGLSQEKAKLAAGYSEKTNATQIEKIGGAVHELMVKALKAKGIDEDYMATEYVDGIKAAKVAGAKDKDLNSHAQYLKQLGYLLGYAKNAPTLALQLNQSQAAVGPDVAIPTRELIAEVSALVEVLKETVGRDKSSGVHAGDSGAIDADACDGVAGLAPEPQDAAGGGGS